MGIVFVYQTSQPDGNFWHTTSVNFGLPYISISIGLNVLLTLMIIVRLVLHTRATRAALGMTGIGGLCMGIITMLVESCALYAVNSFLVIVPWVFGNHTEGTFLSLLSQTQVRAYP